MRAILQRVRWAEVETDGQMTGRIERGLLLYVGVSVGDEADDAKWLAEKVANLRIFEDESGKLNLSVQDVQGGVLVVPNFTLLADVRRGRRPAFVDAAPPAAARPLYETFVEALKQMGCSVAGGVFAASMVIRSAADGPVNVIVETPRGGNSPQQARKD